MAQSIRLGTCGWSYQEWSGVFYPEGLSASDWLSYYAEHYHVVEVDSTFYRTPGPKMVEGWRDKTPDGFGFSLAFQQESRSAVGGQGRCKERDGGNWPTTSGQVVPLWPLAISWPPSPWVMSRPGQPQPSSQTAGIKSFRVRH
jgi:hypothetical protein